MDETKEYLTKEKYEALEMELKELKTNARKEIAEHLEFAKSLGDLSENAEYHEARDKQADLEDRIAQLELILKNSIIITSHRGGNITVGSTVVIERLDGRSNQTETFTIVGSEEANRSAGKISHQSPLGTALLERKKGETVTVLTPKGEVIYKIINIK